MSNALEKQPYSYNKGPYKLRDAPGLVLGTVVIAGGVYGLATLLIGREKARQAAAPPPLRNVDPTMTPAAPGRTQVASSGTYAAPALAYRQARAARAR